MKTAMRLATATATAVSVITLGLGIGGCQFGHPAPSRTEQVSAEPEPPSVLVILLDRDSGKAMTAFRSLLRATVQPDEHIIVIDADTGDTAGSFTTPKGPAMTVPDPPPGLPAHPTGFQTARYHQAMARWQATVNRERARLQLHERQELVTWAENAAATVTPAKDRGAAEHEVHGFVQALSAAVADIASLEQARLQFASRKVLAVVGFDWVPTATMPRFPAQLQGLTVAVSGFSGTATEEDQWRTGLVQLGAARAVLLTAAASDVLPGVVEQGLVTRTGRSY